MTFWYKKVMAHKRNIALTGFMGTGKSTVGRRLAAELGLKFLDIDDLIEKDAGMPIREIFKKDGEARFRRLESSVIEKLSSGAYGNGVVISTGGGAVVNPANRSLLKSWATLVCLRASVDEILRRVGDKVDRPLLSAPDKRAAVERLLGERQQAYLDADFTVETTGRGVDDIVAEIKGLIETGA